MKMNTEGIDRLVEELVRTTLVRFTIQFFNKGANGLKPFGSGVLVKIHEHYFILTASHVADFLVKEENQLYVKVDHKGFINVIGEIKYTDIDKSKGIDLAYIKISDEMLPHLEKPYFFLTVDKFRKHHKILNSMNYCVIGFPEKNVKREDGMLKTGTTFFLTSAWNEKPYDYYKMPEKDFLIVLMEGKGIDIETDEKTKVDTHFYGISGCGLWYLMFRHDKDDRVTVDYRLIGIMTEFKKGKYFCLIANKIHLYIEAFTAIEGYEFREISVK